MNGRWGWSRAAVAAAAAALATVAAMPGFAAAASLCVGGAGCYTSVQAAVDAAHDGDTIQVNPGTYAGGVTITTSVTLQGAGAGLTRIVGGGPVLTIGRYGATTEPTVTIAGLTLTGGVTRTSAQSNDWVGMDGIVALGGGIEIPPAADYALGATVTIRDSSITGNRVAPNGTAPVGPPCPGGSTCPFALAGGGGIDSWGSLTLVGTTVSGNLVGTPTGLSSLASDVQGGGIMSWSGPVAIRASSVSGNQAGASAPNGRFADGGGLMLEGGSLDMRDSAVSGNVVTLAAGLPDSVDLLAVAGGIHIGNGVSQARIAGSTFAGNAVSMTNSVGSSNVASGAIHVDLGPTFELRDSTVTGNSVSSRTIAGSTGNAFGDSAVGEMHGLITGTRFSGNALSVQSQAGLAVAAGGVSIFTGTISDSVLLGNAVSATSLGATAYANGGALLADEGGITVRGSTLRGNTVNAVGLTGAYGSGGAIFDSPIPDGPPGGPLTLVGSTVTGNVLGGSAGAVLHGGGIYAVGVSTSLNGTVVAHNVPDQCYGC